MRIVFMGTPEFAVPSLNALIKAGYEVVGVFCQPDKPRGRGGKVTYCPVKEAALEAGLSIYQPLKTRSSEGLAMLRSLEPDLVVTAAYGQILSKANLGIPRYGTINVHASLLPKYRGPAPVQWAIINGEKVTGVTTMFTDIGIDTGDIILKREMNIDDDATYGEILERLSYIGADVLIETIGLIEKGTLTKIAQNPDEATHFPMLEKEHGKIDFSKSAKQIVDLVRGVNPWPGAFIAAPSGILKVWKAAPAKPDESPRPQYGLEGTAVISNQKEGLFVLCGNPPLYDMVELVEVQAPGGKRMAARDYLRGKPIALGTQLNTEYNNGVGKDEA